MDCKDNVVKFYNFKRKVQRIHVNNRKNERGTKSIELKERGKNKQNKIVKNIYDIVQNFVEKCSVVTIKVSETNKQLTIESKEEETKRNFVHIKEELELEKLESSNGSILKCNTLQTVTDVIDLSEIISVKQEPEELPDITFEDYTEYYPDQTFETFSQKSSDWSDPERPISKAALKMRKYREKLKLPENREKFLEHKERQKFWNRRHYLRKQAGSSKTCRT